MSTLAPVRPKRNRGYIATGMILCGLLATGIGIYCLTRSALPPGSGPPPPELANTIMEIRRLAFFTVAMGTATAVAGVMMLWKARPAKAD